MQYANIRPAEFVKRLNRFVAVVKVDGREESVHVKNTGRCRELLLPGSEVWLTEPGSPGRKTRFDLVAVRKSDGVLYNIDSQAPNRVVHEWLLKGEHELIRPEFTYGGSRIDFYLETSGERTLMEVKGCTLEIGGIGYFPDAPTERGVKHVRELIRAREEGCRAALAFVLQMDGVKEVRANKAQDPAFAKAWEDAMNAGVKIIFYRCHVEPDRLEIISEEIMG